jgi:putative aldouronate transport system substrate-binding protein
MKKNYCIVLIIILVISIIFTSCGGTENSEVIKNTEETTQKESGDTSTTSNKSSTSGDVWAMEGWEKAPLNDVLPGKQWVNFPKMTEEFVWRQTDPSVEREMEGNMYTTGWPIVKEKETLKVFARQSPLIIDVETHYFVENLEKKTNIHIEWILAPEAELTTKRNLALASGDYPDIFYGCGFSQIDLMLYGTQQNILLPLNEYIDKYGYYFKQLLELKPEVKGWITAPDGNIYAIPTVYENFHVKYPIKGWINQSWLDNLNLEMPKTTEEYYQVLKAFKTKDPNNNGKADEMPLVGSPKGWYTNIDYFFMMPFVLNYPHHRIVESDNITVSVDKSEYREGLRWLNKLYKEGLLDRDSFVRDGEQLKQLGNNPDVEIIGSVPAGGYVIFVDQESPDRRAEHWVTMPPLKGPNGVINVGYSPFQYSPGSLVITTACKNPAVAYRWADWMLSPEWHQYQTNGRYGKEWDYSDGTKENLFGGKAVYKKIASDDLAASTRSNIYWEAMGGPFCTLIDEYGYFEADPTEYNTRVYKYVAEYYANKGYEAKELYPNLFIPLEEVDEYSQISSEFTKYVNESFAKFVTGELDIDDDNVWKEYLKQLEKTGMNRMLEIDQEAYEIYLRNK